MEYGQKYSNIRSQVLGYMIIAFSYLMDGDFSSAIETSQKAINTSSDPFYSQIPRMQLSMGYLYSKQFDEAENAAREVMTYSHKFGAGVVAPLACLVLGVASIAKGHMNQGLSRLQEAKRALKENERRAFYARVEYVLGNLYLQIVEGTGPKSFSTMIKNFGFLIKNVPLASKKAEDHFKKAIKVAEEIGAKGIQGQAYLDLGLLHRAKKRYEQARECLSTAIQIFEECETEAYLKKSKNILASLE